MTSTTPTPIGDLDDPVDVLVYARACQVESDRAQASQFIAAATWAEQHPPESIDEAASWLAGGGVETGIPLAGPGAPLVAEFCIAEFALAIGRSTDSGRAFIAHAVETKYRLPRMWARVVSGQLPAWRARRIADSTLGLSMEAATFVDTQIAPFAHKIGIAALDRLVDEAIARFMPDLADALDLEDAVTREAAALKAAGSEESLDVRRSQAPNRSPMGSPARLHARGGFETLAGARSSTTGGWARCRALDHRCEVRASG